MFFAFICNRRGVTVMNGLKRELLPRHIRMIALGGAIGAGIFQGSAETLSLAGPGVIVAYLFAGLLQYIIMGAMAEMALAHPGLDLRALMRKAFGARVSFVIGWLYWLDWILVMAVETVAAGTFLSFWFPHVPLWLFSLAVAILLVVLNLTSVRLFGEIEFWLAGVKIFTLTAFILLGIALLIGLLPGHPGPSVLNWTTHGGFFPRGFSGVITALPVVVFAFGGTEMIGMTLTEMKDRERALPAVIRSVVLRISLFYVLPLFLITGLLPWNEIGTKGSPFVQMLSSVGLAGAAHVMNFIMLTAVFSAANSGMYATSRTLFSLAREGEAPALLTRVNRRGVPTAGVLLSSLGLFAGAVVAFCAPRQVFQVLMAIPGFTALSIWTMVLLAQFRLKPDYNHKPGYRLAAFPYLTGFGLASLFFIQGAILLNPQNEGNNLLCLAVVLVLIILARFCSGRTGTSLNKIG
jgi:AAT family amino acid transporter